MFAAISATVALASPTQKKSLLHRGTFATRLFDKMPLSRRGAFVVCSKMRRRRRPRPTIQYNGEGEGEGEGRGGVGRSILAVLNPEEPSKAGEQRRSGLLWSEKEREEDRSSPSLSGSDVLFALQRAAAQKASRRRQGTKGRPSMHGKSEDGSQDLSNARPIKIRSDWAARLDEVERKLEELMKLEEHSA